MTSSVLRQAASAAVPCLRLPVRKLPCSNLCQGNGCHVVEGPVEQHTTCYTVVLLQLVITERVHDAPAVQPDLLYGSDQDIHAIVRVRCIRVRIFVEFLPVARPEIL